MERFDLATLASSDSDYLRRLERLVVESDELAAQLARCERLDQASFLETLAALRALADERSLLELYAYLSEAAAYQSEQARDLVTRFEETRVALEAPAYVFTDLWCALSDDDVELLLGLAGSDRHWLVRERLVAAHNLGARSEELVAAHEPLRAAWVALYEASLSDERVVADLGDGPVTWRLEDLENELSHPRLERRKMAADALYPALARHAELAARAYDALVADRLAQDELRSWPHPMASANAANDLLDELVEELLRACEEHYSLARRWLVAKRVSLGLGQASLLDQFAELPGGRRDYSLSEARAKIIATLATLDTDLGDRVGDYFSAGRVDARRREGKQAGGFAAFAGAKAKPFVFFNFAGRSLDVVMLAHELGHALQFELAAEAQGTLAALPTTALAEVPATFCELLLFEQLTEDAAADKRALAASRLEASLMSVLRQGLLTRFEQRAYALRAQGMTLTRERLGELWLALNGDYFGPETLIPLGYEDSWSLFPHLIGARFYTYSYAFARLAALALFARRRKQGPAFAKSFRALLAAGGSAAPLDAFAALGFGWEEILVEGFAELDRELAEASAFL